MTKEVGTLAEIGAKPGDTVRLVENGIIAGRGVGNIGVVVEGDAGDLYTRGDDMCRGDDMGHKFRIVSRAYEKRDTKTGTLAELNVKPGDVVEWGGETWTVSAYSEHSDSIHALRDARWISGSAEGCRIVSRAEETPKLWRDMTPEEKGALLLAHHEGKVIEIRYGSLECGEWKVTLRPEWINNYAYRIKPEPKVETVTLLTAKVYDWFSAQENGCGSRNTHRITFNLIDGEPDCTSIKMEKLQ